MSTRPESRAHDLCANGQSLPRAPHRHGCGQPVEGLVRPLGSVLGDGLDTLREYDGEYDGRPWHTLGPLSPCPGRLTLDFFAGRRGREIGPFRLAFFIGLRVFPAVQFGMSSTP